MPAHWPIRTKLKIGLALLLVTVLSLFASAYYGLYAYRGLVRSLRARSAELPLASDVRQQVSDMRVTLSKAKERLELPDVIQLMIGDLGLVESADGTPSDATDSTERAELAALPHDAQFLREEFYDQLDFLNEALDRYRRQLDQNQASSDVRLGDDARERETLGKIDELVRQLNNADSDWLLDELQLGQMRDQVEQLGKFAAELPSHLHERLGVLATEVRARYRTAIVVAWLNAGMAVALLGVFFLVFYQSFAKPFGKLVEGSRQVAAGVFEHQIHLEARDEMGELAHSMNAMTTRFREIRDDLDQQVRERTNQVVRSEQLASVGFLAAGVSHEINNPLASIALCSESLESRLGELLDDRGSQANEDVQVARNYLQMIQREAFRCKQITEKLLDFARIGDSQFHAEDLRELIAGVMEMVQHLGKYQNKNINLTTGPPVLADVNAQELKQVMLNLITNALESVDAGGMVSVSVDRQGERAVIAVEDNGCGMTDEVRKHLFEPFFTRRRTGQGTGLGLSITYRIVQEHGGTIEALSDGVGRGSKFTVTLPVHQSSQETRHGDQAA